MFVSTFVRGLSLGSSLTCFQSRRPSRQQDNPLRGILDNVIYDTAAELKTNRQAKYACDHISQSFICGVSATKKAPPGELVQYLAVMHHALLSSKNDADPIKVCYLHMRCFSSKL